MKTAGSLVEGTREEITLAAAAYIAGRVFRAVGEQESCTMVLPGGSSPRPLFRKLASGVPVGLLERSGIPFPERAVTVRDGLHVAALPWRSVSLFWGDERCVPAGHPDSNFRMAKESLIESLADSRPELHPMPHAVSNGEQAASAYEKTLRRFFQRSGRPLQGSFPVFDMVILGMGPDGHTASLFPGDSQALGETLRWVVPVHAAGASPPGRRLSLTLPVINNADAVAFFVTGSAKEPLLRDVVSNRREDLPAGKVRPAHGELRWFYSP